MPALSVESGRLGSPGITHYANRIATGVECSHPEKHHPLHVQHPTSGTDRRVCLICHPPACALKDGLSWRI
jgi:hypothetical protein